MTIHKFQGFEAGQTDDDHINHLIVNCGSEADEHRCPGLLYVATSRAKTIGDKNIMFPTNSSLYWMGDGMSTDRVRNLGKKFDKNINGFVPSKAVLECREWVTYITDIAEKTAAIYSEETLKNIMNTTLAKALNEKYNSKQIDELIMKMVLSPNETWKKLKKSDKYTVKGNVINII